MSERAKRPSASWTGFAGASAGLDPGLTSGPRTTIIRGTQVNLFFTSKGPARSAVTVQHAKLAARRDAEKAKAFWHGRLDALREVLR